MTEDMEEECKIIGKRREEITQLLGLPDFDAGNKITYIIGINLIDPIYYEIELKNGIATTAKTEKD